MNETAIAYMAGILDGEGSIAIQKSGLAPVIDIWNTDKALMEWFVQEWGMNYHVSAPVKGITKRQKEIFRCSLSGREAIRIAKEVIKYSICKKEQFEIIILCEGADKSTKEELRQKLMEIHDSKGGRAEIK